MNLKPITALIALSLALAGCGNKGPLVQAGPPPMESMPADAEIAAPAETVPVEPPAVDAPPVDAVPADAPPAEEPLEEAPLEEAPPATEVPAADGQDG